eukprot:Blabericola_migrator_1__1232@NODE_1316_length_4835_cov_118_803482_g886_i0_p1_GENE_NODE_1316_length_4835_cov_118_803482_g886_i0NODE_1316_length_4835_cov_118_803482_g886_i0_p1_ORF_typecomplete_len1019_score155_07_NODE_1316_length_4835_cov_118_803482_g886_i06063662
MSSPSSPWETWRKGSDKGLLTPSPMAIDSSTTASSSITILHPAPHSRQPQNCFTRWCCRPHNLDAAEFSIGSPLVSDGSNSPPAAYLNRRRVSIPDGTAFQLDKLLPKEWVENMALETSRPDLQLPMTPRHAVAIGSADPEDVGPLIVDTSSAMSIDSTDAVALETLNQYLIKVTNDFAGRSPTLRKITTSSNSRLLHPEAMVPKVAPWARRAAAESAIQKASLVQLKLKSLAKRKVQRSNHALNSDASELGSDFFPGLRSDVASRVEEFSTCSRGDSKSFHSSAAAPAKILATIEGLGKGVSPLIISPFGDRRDFPAVLSADRLVASPGSRYLPSVTSHDRRPRPSLSLDLTSATSMYRGSNDLHSGRISPAHISEGLSAYSLPEPNKTDQELSLPSQSSIGQVLPQPSAPPRIESPKGLLVPILKTRRDGETASPHHHLKLKFLLSELSGVQPGSSCKLAQPGSLEETESFSQSVQTAVPLDSMLEGMANAPSFSDPHNNGGLTQAVSPSTLSDRSLWSDLPSPRRLRHGVDKLVTYGGVAHDDSESYSQTRLSPSESFHRKLSRQESPRRKLSRQESPHRSLPRQESSQNLLSRQKLSHEVLDHKRSSRDGSIPSTPGSSHPESKALEKDSMSDFGDPVDRQAGATLVGILKGPGGDPMGEPKKVRLISPSSNVLNDVIALSRPAKIKHKHRDPNWIPDMNYKRNSAEEFMREFSSLSSLSMTSSESLAPVRLVSEDLPIVESRVQSASDSCQKRSVDVSPDDIDRIAKEVLNSDSMKQLCLSFDAAEIPEVTDSWVPQPTATPRSAALGVFAFTTKFTEMASTLSTFMGGPQVRLKRMDSGRAMMARTRFEKSVPIEAIVLKPDNKLHLEKNFFMQLDPEACTITVRRGKTSKTYDLKDLVEMDSSEKCLHRQVRWSRRKHNNKMWLNPELPTDLLQRTHRLCVLTFAGRKIPLVVLFESTEDLEDFIELIGLMYIETKAFGSSKKIKFYRRKAEKRRQTRSYSSSLLDDFSKG